MAWRNSLPQSLFSAHTHYRLLTCSTPYCTSKNNYIPYKKNPDGGLIEKNRSIKKIIKKIKYYRNICIINMNILSCIRVFIQSIHTEVIIIIVLSLNDDLTSDFFFGRVLRVKDLVKTILVSITKFNN